MKVRIDAERCQGHVMCVLACPEIFHIRDEDGHGYVPDENVAPEFEAKVRLAVRSCPEKAVLIEDG